MSQQAAEQQQQQQQQPETVQVVRDLCLAPQHAAAQQQAQQLHQQEPLLCNKQHQHLQATRMRSPFLQAQQLQDGTAFDTLAAQLLDALGQCHPTHELQQTAQPAPQQAHSTRQHAHCMQQHAMHKHQQQQEEGWDPCRPHPLLPPTAAAAVRKFGSAKLSPVGASLQQWGSLVEEGSEAGADADAQLPADADCAALVADLAAPCDSTAVSLAVSTAAATTAAASPGDSAASLAESAIDQEHHCEVRTLLESCLTEAAERARSESTQDSSAIASGLLLLGEDSSLCSSCSFSGTMTESGAIAIDWDAILHSELFGAGFNSSNNTDMQHEVLQPTADSDKQGTAAAATAAAAADSGCATAG